MNIYGRKTKYAILGIPGLRVESLMDNVTVDSPFVFQGLVINNKVFKMGTVATPCCNMTCGYPLLKYYIGFISLPCIRCLLLLPFICVRLICLVNKRPVCFLAKSICGCYGSVFLEGQALQRFLKPKAFVSLPEVCVCTCVSSGMCLRQRNS